MPKARTVVKLHGDEEIMSHTFPQLNFSIRSHGQQSYLLTKLWPYLSPSITGRIFLVVLFSISHLRSLWTAVAAMAMM